MDFKLGTVKKSSTENLLRTSAELKLESLSDLGEELRASYPNKPDEIRLVQLAIKQEPGKPAVSDHTDHGNVGFRFTS